MASLEHEMAVAALAKIRASGGDASALARLFPRPEPDVVCVGLDAGGVGAEWVSIGPRTSEYAILYFHGGGYTEGSLGTHRELVSRISRHSGIPVLSVDYRLAPANPFPAAVDDARMAWAWLTQTIAAHKIAVAGDSAGGGLAIALLFTLRDKSEPMPAFCALISPWCDLEIDSESAVCADDPLIAPDQLRKRGLCYAGLADLRHPLASPINGCMGNLPPLFIQVGDREVLLDDACRVNQKALAAGGRSELEVWEGMTHVWHILGDSVPEARAATQQLGAAINSALRTSIT